MGSLPGNIPSRSRRSCSSNSVAVNPILILGGRRTGSANLAWPLADVRHVEFFVDPGWSSYSGLRYRTVPFRNSTPAQTPAAAEAKPVQLFANPSFRFDPSVGLVVIEFHDDAGNVENSIPSQRQLAAYRTHQQTLPGQRAPGAPTSPPVAMAKLLLADRVKDRDNTFLGPLIPALERHHDVRFTVRARKRWPTRSHGLTLSGWNGAGITRCGPPPQIA